MPLYHRQSEADLAKLRTDLRMALDAMLQHRVYLQDRLGQLRNQVQEKHLEIAQLQAPSAKLA